MKFHFIAEDLLSSKVKVATLKFILRYPKKKFTGRELARLTTSSPSSILKTLELLQRYGLVYKNRVGKATEWIVNPQHLLAKKLSALLMLDEAAFSVLSRKIKDFFAQNHNILKVIVFGSIVKEEEEPNSDIDLFVLVKKPKYKNKILAVINKLNALLIPLLGNSISVIVYSANELKTKKNLTLIKHIFEEGKLIIDHA